MRSRSAPIAVRAWKRRVSVPISALTPGLATRFWYQSGSVGAPPLVEKTATEPPRSWYISGLTRSLPLRAPIVWRSSNGAPLKLPPTFPPLARNSSTMSRFHGETFSPMPLSSRLIEWTAQSRDEDDLPLDVTGLELGERPADFVEWVGALDRNDEVAGRYGLGKFGQGCRARCGRAALALDAVLRDRGKVDDRVDPVPCDAEFECELDVAASDEVDERGNRCALGGRGDALTDTVAIGDGNRAALAQPCVVALAGQCDDACARTQC